MGLCFFTQSSPYPPPFDYTYAMGEITEIDEDSKDTMEGAPELPPGMSKFANMTSDEMLKELKKSPFFMDEYDPSQDEGDNPQLEALKSLQSEGTPDERAEIFKERGNDLYRGKKYKEAAEAYTQGIEVECGTKYIEAALYTNRAACNLALKNYARCIRDCRQCLDRQPKNVKALFRCASAMFAISKYDDAEKVLEYAVSIDNKSTAVNSLLKKVVEKKRSLEEARERKEREAAEKKQREGTLQKALAAREVINIKTSLPADTPDGSKLHLEDANDVESQLIIPTMVVYPTTGEFDFVAEVSELSTPLQLAEIVMDRPDSYFEDDNHKNFRPKKLEAYLETISGGLIKIGKKVTFGKAFAQAHAPLFDGLLRVYLVPKVEASSWVSKWDKRIALGKRAVQ
ncbi:DEKNAAC102132 [Brettanomyces naardenensis]|uniref:DEKNAAC102133 n=1 Tax=Brettanomyces naardenensis TaxID=13370 RepID=A0A448YK44_BRENA|nr:DEKNAAC102132 [Brettanomyces naardenensis]